MSIYIIFNINAPIMNSTLTDFFLEISSTHHSHSLYILAKRSISPYLAYFLSVSNLLCVLRSFMKKIKTTTNILTDYYQKTSSIRSLLFLHGLPDHGEENPQQNKIRKEIDKKR
jgi:hypothetical protein